jgi:glycosyltransferase involved in cell wall biosynthesis
MVYDLIIVVSSQNKKLIDITKRCIDSARVDVPDLHVIVIETWGKPYSYPCEVVQYTGQFNYNRALNEGIKRAKGDVFILANNDIFFHPGWSVIGDLMLSNNFGSASALSGMHLRRGYRKEDCIYPGYAIGSILTGWCLFVTCETIRKIGKLDETNTFWYSDNAYAEQLKAKNIRHGLFCNIQVDHLESSTLRMLPYRQQRKYTKKQ